MGEGMWTRHRSGGELFVYYMFFGFAGLIGRLMFRFPWWSFFILAGLAVIVTVRAMVRGRRARERERALLERFAE